MAKKKVVTPERQALDDFDAKYKDKELTDAQEREREKLYNALGAAQFTRIGEKKLNSVVRQMDQLGKLFTSSRYKHTPAQAKIISESLEAAAERLAASIKGNVAASAAIKL